MKSFIKILGTTVAVVLVALFVMGWAPDVTNFSSTQFGNDGSTVYLKSGVNLTNVAFYGSDPLDASNLFGTLNITSITGTISSTNLDLVYAVTVANLGTPQASTFPLKYCSDVLTPYGTGGYVFYDGTFWRTRLGNIKAAADYPTYILNCVEAGLNASSRFSFIGYGVSEITPGNVGWARSATSSGSGATASTGATGGRGGGGYFYTGLLQTGTTTGGACAASSGGFLALTSGDFLAGGGCYYSSAAGTNGGDNYWETVGLMPALFGSAASGIVFPQSGVYFLYDPGNTSTLVTSATNDWWWVNAKAGSYTSGDTGLPHSITSTSMDELLCASTTTNSMFWTNGVLCAQSALNIPTLALSAGAMMVKTNGTTSRFTGEGLPHVHYRRIAGIPTP